MKLNYQELLEGRGESGHMCWLECWRPVGLSTEATLSEDKAQGVKALAVFGMFQAVFGTG